MLYTRVGHQMLRLENWVVGSSFPRTSPLPNNRVKERMTLSSHKAVMFIISKQGKHIYLHNTLNRFSVLYIQ